MSKPIRYGLADADLGRIHPQADGHLVMWADYAALAAENERLKELVESNLNIGKKVLGQSDALRIERDALAAENERLRLAEKLMDQVSEDWRLIQINQSGGSDIMFAVAAWLAAKEGAAK